MSTKQPPTAEGINPAKLYTNEQIAEFMGITPWHVRNLMRDGRIGYVKTSEHRGRRISGQDYLDYIARNRVPAEV